MPRKENEPRGVFPLLPFLVERVGSAEDGIGIVEERVERRDRLVVGIGRMDAIRGSEPGEHVRAYSFTSGFRKMPGLKLSNLLLTTREKN